MDAGCGYAVKVCRKETVTAKLPLQEHRLALSNLDLLLPPLDVGVFLCYPKPSPATLQHPVAIGGENSTIVSTFASLVTVLKASLAKALVTYYPFAGEVATNSMGEPELLCNNRGVEFIEAFADIRLSELDFHDADESFERKLVAKKKDGVLTIQATEMKCGGLVLGCTFDHRIADAYSFNMFLLAWTHTAAGRPISPVPSFRRSLLSPRHPDRHQPSLDRLFVPLSQLPPQNSIQPSSDAVNRMYYITASDIHLLQKLATKPGRSTTKVEAFAAYLWKLIGRAGKGAQVSQMGIVVDGRRRLGPTMDAYFGNVLSVPYASMAVDEMRLEDVAQEVHEVVALAANEEHFIGLVDWVEAKRPETAVARVYVEEGLSVVVSSGRGFPVAEVEFGWGKAALGSYHFPWQGSAGYVMPMLSAKGNGDWVIYAHLSREIVEAVEADSSGFFRPLTADYLLIK